MQDEPVSPWYSAYDVLRQVDPVVTAALAASFPQFQDELAGRRIFGAAPSDQEGDTNQREQRLALARASLTAVAAAATSSLDEALGAVNRRARTLARIRFGSGLVSTLGGAGVLAFLADSGGVPRAAISAVIAIAGSLLSLFSGYLEDQSGGTGSVSQLRATALELVGTLAEIRGRIDMGLATRTDQSVAIAMTSLNAAGAKLAMVRARLGLSVGEAAG